MGKKRQILLAVLIVAAVIGGLANHFSQSAPQEPTYKGRTLRYWLRGYRVANSSWDGLTPQMASEALGYFGTNAFPTLLEMLAAKDSAFDAKWLQWSYTWRSWAQKQHAIRIYRAPHLRSYEIVEAMYAFREFGSNASNAVPGLINLLELNLPRRNQSYLEIILAGIGPSASQAVPVLLTKSQDSDGNLRGNAVHALGAIHADPELVVPTITKALDDPDSYVRVQAAQAFKTYGSLAEPYVPGDPLESVKEALGEIDPEAARKEGVK